MLKGFLDIIIVILLFIFIKLFLFRFTPKKSREIYSVKLAHRGFHMLYPENTIESYKAAIDANMGIEMDIRFLDDGNIVCFHDRYTKRLLNIPGKISTFTLSKIKKLYITDSKCKVPTLEEALIEIGKETVALIEVKGNITDNNLYCLKTIIYSYSNISNIYFHTKNILTYKKLRKVFGDKVFYVLNPFRKRMNFIKGSDYKVYIDKYSTMLQEIDIEIPSPDDFAQIITKAIQDFENKSKILTTIGKIINSYESRTDKDHWVNNSLWAHRGIISDKYPEHSKEAFKECIRFAKEKDIYVTVEFDVMLYKGQVRCYHKDKISSILGQKKSCAEKVKLDNSLTLSEILDFFAGSEEYINLAIDIKDYHIKNKVLPDLIINAIEKSNFKGNFIVMSYNPLVLNYFKKERKDYLRAQIGHSLSGLRKVPFFRFPWLLNGFLGVLFDIGHADAILFDNSKSIFPLTEYNKNIIGKLVLVYAPQTYMEIEGFIGKESISNFITENASNKDCWPDEEYFEKFKRKKVV